MMSDPTEVKTRIKRFAIFLSEDEAMSCRYALYELANRRQEQAIDLKAPRFNEEAARLRALASYITKDFVKP